jgi:hypothetical protein
VLGTETYLLNKKNNSYVITAATLFTLAIIAASIIADPAVATTTTTNGNTSTYLPRTITGAKHNSNKPDTHDLNILWKWHADSS